MEENEIISESEIVTVVKTTNITRGTIEGEGNWILFCNNFTPAGHGTIDASEVAAWCHDASWEFLKVSTEF